MDQCIPLCQSKRKSNVPWITKDLIKQCRKKKSLYNKVRKSANPFLWEKYRKLNNAVKRECNQARWTYINNLASDLNFSVDSKPFWDYVKRKRNGTNNLVSLNVGDEVLTDDSSIASSLNSYFSSVFTTEDLANMPSLEPTACEKLDVTVIPKLWGNKVVIVVVVVVVVDVISCTSGEVMKYLKSLKPNKSPGPDCISPVILRSCASELAPLISYLVNEPFQFGHLPDDWRSADIVPLHKKGSKHLRENYRPISLTSIVFKISEKIVRNKITSFWQNQVVINKNQFGFLQGRSTTTQLLSTIHDFAKSRNSSYATDVIFLDLAKAFDSVPHERLLIKLRSLGLEENLLNWLRHFLTCRKQRVVVRGTFSEWAPVVSGTPQGAILGPILLVPYINNIADCVSSDIKLFSDDTKIYTELCNLTSDIQMLQSDLDSLGYWANTWQLRYNEEKCEAMRITHSRDNLSTDYSLGTTLKDVKSVKDLGVVISKDLSWSQHISTIVNKAKQVLGLIRRTVGTANTSTFSLLYKSLVRPLLEYAVPVWNPYLVKDIHAIENVQRCASRLALRQKRGDMPYEERCNILTWPLLSTRRTYFSLVECYKIVFGLSLLDFKEFFEFATVHSTRANHSYKLFS